MGMAWEGKPQDHEYVMLKVPYPGDERSAHEYKNNLQVCIYSV